MGINIGDNNNIKKSVIGNDNRTEKKDDILVTIIISIVAGVIVAGIAFYLGWN